jgi:hypothetical protein
MRVEVELRSAMAGYVLEVASTSGETVQEVVQRILEQAMLEQGARALLEAMAIAAQHARPVRRPRPSRAKLRAVAPEAGG